MADEKYLEGDPNSFVWGQGEFQGSGGGTQAGRYYAWKKYNQLFGHNPTEAELTQLTAGYMSGDQNIANVAGGDALVAAYYNSKINSPENQYKREQDELLKKAPEKYGDVDAIYKDLYERGATQDELQHFGKMLASGEVDPYELRQFVMSQSEYQGKQDEKFRAGVADELGEYDRKVFDREKEDVISRFARAGRLNSSSLDYALTDLMGKIGEERSKYLAQLSASQYQGNKIAARADYETALDRYFGRDDYGTQRANQLDDMITGRIFGIDDYNRQMNDYERYMASKRPSRLQNAASGAMAGAAAGAPAGGVGAGIGAVGGGLFGYFNS